MIYGLSKKNRKYKWRGNMRSNKKQVQTGQKESFERKLKNRLTYLSERGIESPVIDKDAIVKHLQGKIRSINLRLKTIDGQEKKNEELAKKKVEKAAPQEVSEGTKTKKEKETPAEGKEKKKKKE
jgi:hypothetical protein